MTYQMNRRPEFARNWAKQIRLLFLLKSLPRVQNYGFEFDIILVLNELSFVIMLVAS